MVQFRKANFVKTVMFSTGRDKLCRNRNIVLISFSEDFGRGEANVNIYCGPT